ncbi:50S ribosomal protein L11 methyltransferase [bacterium]|nr:50S ribosomal protein L11 methyltransferase [bacterium]
MSETHYYELEIDCPQFSHELLTSVLQDIGFSGFIPKNDHLLTYIHQLKWTPTQADRLSAFLSTLTETGVLPELHWRIHAADGTDWVNRWRRALGAVHAGEHFVIVPPGVDYTPQPEEITLNIEPRMAFGTGDHATTRMALALLEPHAESAERVLDLGCGNGVLLLGALLKGAKQGIGIDNEEESFQESRENLESHGLQERAEIIHGDALHFSLDSIFDLIVANILYLPILEGLPNWTVHASENSCLILTGIEANEGRSRLDELTRELGWKVEREMIEQEWFAARYFLRRP